MDENLEEEELDNIVILNDEEGNEVKFEFLDIVELDNDLQNILENRNNILLLGDGISDLDMIPKEKRNNAITVGFLEENIKESLDFYNKNFDIVITDNGSYDDINKIINIY